MYCASFKLVSENALSPLALARQTIGDMVKPTLMMSKSSSLDKHRTIGDDQVITIESNVVPVVKSSSSPVDSTRHWW
jgi:hypothetical protein